MTGQVEEVPVNDPLESKGPKVPPAYPPRTPPPSKKPVEAPQPQPKTKPVTTSLPLPGPAQARLEIWRPRMIARNRRVANWLYEANRWAPRKATAAVMEAVRRWEYVHPANAALEEVVGLLVGAAVEDGGKRISVHLADQDDLLLIAVLSHTDAQPDEQILGQLQAVTGIVSCGTEASEEGRRLWTLLSTEPPRRTAVA
ncbi:hypothetical protein [Streptomyces sp. NPDC085479]|uniref:hypothetical protein n=1 Tax=Streptomyces sp. NPDC085479 TaxID=3365726 RepID=UPI0037CCF215